jgi:hypothetical protein
MPDAGESGLMAIRADAVLQDQVTSIDVNFDAVAKESHDAVTWHY